MVIKAVAVKPNLWQSPINASSSSGAWPCLEGNLGRPLAASDSAAVSQLDLFFVPIPGSAHQEARMPFSHSNNDPLLA